MRPIPGIVRSRSSVSVVVNVGFFFDRALEFSDHGVVAIRECEIRLDGPLDHAIVERLGQSLLDQSRKNRRAI